MDHDVAPDWPSEDIPDDATLFIRVHINLLDAEGKPMPGAFRNLPVDDPSAGMSTNWDRYATAEQTRSQGARQPPENYAVFALRVADLRQRLPELRVQHTPEIELGNRSHTDVFGEKTPRVRVLLAELASLVLAPGT